MRWTRKAIVAEIRRLHADGAELNYATAEQQYLNLVRAAAWHFGTWRMAIEAAGLDYGALSKYRRWNRDRIVERIKELHTQGVDLSWRSISIEVDPPLAAAALRANGFSTWREAIAAAGLDINEVARYQYWNEERVLREIKALHRRKAPLSSKAAQENQQKLFCAARRRFGSWDDALGAAGLEAGKIRLRQAGGRSTGKISSEPSRAPRKTSARSSSARTAARNTDQVVLPFVEEKPQNPRAKSVAPKATPKAVAATVPKTAANKALVRSESPKTVAPKAKPAAVKPSANTVRVKAVASKTSGAKAKTGDAKSQRGAAKAAPKKTVRATAKTKK
ncbi:MAG TPA: hypothetical protein VF681_07810 [Abditibacteriaceae bacterium]